jgi:hypothetical protein
VPVNDNNPKDPNFVTATTPSSTPGAEPDDRLAARDRAIRPHPMPEAPRNEPGAVRAPGGVSR